MDSDYISDALESLACWLMQETGLAVLYDPQPIQDAAPHVRLTFMGVEDRGDGPVDVKWQLNVIGAGTGPDIYLPSVISASCRVNDLYNPCLSKGRRYADILTKAGNTVRVLFPTISDASGQFIQNDADGGETQQWRYVYTESHYIIMTLPRQGEGATK